MQSTQSKRCKRVAKSKSYTDFGKLIEFIRKTTNNEINSEEARFIIKAEEKLEFSSGSCYLQIVLETGFVQQLDVICYFICKFRFIYFTKYIERRNRRFLDISDKFCENLFYS